MLNNRVAGTFSRNEDVYQDPATGNWFTNRPRERQLLHPPLFVPLLFPTDTFPAHSLAQTSRRPCSFSILLSSTHRFSLVLSLVAETNLFEFSVHRQKTFSISSLVAKIDQQRKVSHTGSLRPLRSSNRILKMHYNYVSFSINLIIITCLFWNWYNSILYCKK